jgi:hypothetical protein
VLNSGDGGGDLDQNETGEASEAEFFPIYAECGMVPDDFEEGTARSYAAYLAKQENRSTEATGKKFEGAK